MADSPEKIEFVSLLTNHQRRLYGYIATLLPNPTDTEEVLQQTNLVLWSKAEEFVLGTSFRAWSFRIAYLEVIAYCRRSNRERQLFGAELLETIGREAEDHEAHSAGHRAVALKGCLDKLRSADRELISARYRSETPVQQLAAAMGRPLSSVYRSLERIRFTLLECVKRTLATEESP